MWVLRLIIISLVLFTGCKKERIYSITGRLLESSSNPVPVSNYKIEMYQRGSSGFGIPSVSSPAEAETITDQSGSLHLNYMPGKGFFLGIPSSNAHPISINGKDTQRINFYLNNLQAQKDTNLQNTFLFKLIKTVTVKLKFTAPILPGDTIKINTPTKTGYYTKSVTGLSSPANSELTVIQIDDVIFSFFNYFTNRYSSSIIAQIKPAGNANFKSLYEGFPLANLPPLDEQQKDFIFY